MLLPSSTFSLEGNPIKRIFCLKKAKERLKFHESHDLNLYHNNIVAVDLN